MRISVIIPVLNEEKSIAATLAELQRLKPDELILVDGGSSDGTREVCQRFGVELYPSRAGRAAQMNFGAQRSTGDVLLFLHADTRLPPSAFNDIRAALEDRRVVGGRFDLQLDDVRPMLKLIGFMISLRSRLSKVGTGDQAIFVRRELFWELGGYPDITFNGRRRVLPGAEAPRRGGLPAQPGSYLRATLGNGRDMAHDLEDVDAQDALPAGNLAGSLETVLWRHALTPSR